MRTKRTKRNHLRYLPIYGSISTGIIYLGIGVVAILSFLRIKQGGADESSLLAYLNNYLVGKIFVWIILLGTVSYIMWRILETIKDPYEYGKNAKGIARRSGIALSSVADMFIAYSAIQVIMGVGNIQEDGQPLEQRRIVSSVLQENSGELVIISIGAIIFITAIIQFYYGITQGYKERLDIAHFSSVQKKIVHYFAWVGYLARGIILGIIGFFFVKAGMLGNADFVVNTDKAFDFIGDHVGHVYFILVAVGTICYGVFMFILGATYKAQNEK